MVDHIFPSAPITPSQNLSVLARLCACNTLPQDQYALGDFGIDRWNSSLIKFGSNFIDYLQSCWSTSVTIMHSAKYINSDNCTVLD